MNIIHLLGRLVIDPELKVTPTGTCVCRFRVAVPRNADITDFFNVIVWDKTAEFLCNYFKKGERIIVHGQAHNNNYTDRDGKKCYAVEIAGTNLEFADTKASKEADRQQNQPQNNSKWRKPIPENISENQGNSEEIPPEFSYESSEEEYEFK